jgi:hypothetical protein
MTKNPWIEHVKRYAKENNMPYGCAISHASKTYKMKKPNESKPRDLDVVSRELQNLIYITSSDKIAKILNKLNFKGKLQSNKILQGMQILQNFNTVEKMESLIRELNK